MAIRNADVPSLYDVVNGQNPDGSSAKIAEVLMKAHPLMDDMGWKVGNLESGDRVHVRTKDATATWRRMNQGIRPSKGATRAVDETAALLESRGQVDRELAILSGNPAAFREKQGIPHIHGMHDEFAETLIYGNEFFNDTEFTGFMPRFNELANSQVIDAGGSGSNLRSILLVGWAEDKVTGIVPKGTTSGLNHFDTTQNRNIGPDGFPIGDEVDDGSGTGATYLAYRDRWIWRCGLAVPDPRYVVRIANIDLDTLKNDPKDGGAYLEHLLVDAVERFGAGSDPFGGVNAAFYAPREIAGWVRHQQVQAKNNTNFGAIEYGGKKFTGFDGIPFRRTDVMNVDEQRVV